MTFKIGNVELKNNLILAPMAGISNNAFRKICHDFGAGLVFAEMVSDKGLLYENKKTKDLLYMTNDEKPLVQQIFGSNIDTIVKAAIYIDENSNCDIIDINMGCPVPKVAVKSQAGSALLKNPDLIYEIVSKVVESVKKPVTVKIRSGWDDKSINAVEVAKKIEMAGASAITVHGRTRAQGYSGKVDLDIIKSVKENVSIPVIGNGDITDILSAKHMLDYTKCDAIMIGRASLGNPWIFKKIDEYLTKGIIVEGPSMDEIKKVIVEHMKFLINLKGEKVAMLEMRSHGPWYLKGLNKASETRKKMSQTKTKEEFIQVLNAYFDKVV